MATILLVEDDRLVRLVLREALRRAGHSVVEAESDDTARSRLDQPPIDFALLDDDLPDGSGSRLAGEVRRRLGPDVGILVMTACWRDARAAEAMAGGADRYVEKPIDLDGLVPIVEEVLALHASGNGHLPRGG